MTDKVILIGFRTKARENAELFMPVDHGATDAKNAQMHWRRHTAPVAPFVSTLDLVTLAYPARKRVNAFKFRPPGIVGQPPICLAVDGWLCQACNITPAADDPLSCFDDCLFAGFDLGRFFQALAIDVMLMDLKAAPALVVAWALGRIRTLDIVAKLLGGPLSAMVDHRAVFANLSEKLKPDWQEPGHDPHADLDLATEVAVRMGLV